MLHSVQNLYLDSKIVGLRLFRFPAEAIGLANHWRILRFFIPSTVTMIIVRHPKLLLAQSIFPPTVKRQWRDLEATRHLVPVCRDRGAGHAVQRSRRLDNPNSEFS